MLLRSQPPPRDDGSRTLWTLIAVVALTLVVALWPSDCHAQDPRDQLHLARICASEAGLEVTDDCAAIHAVLTDRARRMGVSYRRAACAYSTRTCDRTRSDSRRWIAWLRPDGRRPRGWPERASWSRHRAGWLELYAHAGAVLRGEVASPCRGEVHHWGMNAGIDLRRARIAGWDRVSCGATRNAFWRVPRWSS